MNAVLKEIPTSSPVTQFLATAKKLLIGGKWVAAASGKTFEVTNPATGQVIARVAEGDKADVDAAVVAARRALESAPWATMTPSDRSKIIWRIGDLISKYTDELAELESLDNGKPMTIAKAADVPLAADIFQYMAGWCTKLRVRRSRYRFCTRPECSITRIPGPSRSASLDRSFPGIFHC